jgi:hypothetical protein
MITRKKPTWVRVGPKELVGKKIKEASSDRWGVDLHMIDGKWFQLNTTKAAKDTIMNDYGEYDGSFRVEVNGDDGFRFDKWANKTIKSAEVFNEQSKAKTGLKLEFQDDAQTYNCIMHLVQIENDYSSSDDEGNFPCTAYSSVVDLIVTYKPHR